MPPQEREALPAQDLSEGGGGDDKEQAKNGGGGGDDNEQAKKDGGDDKEQAMADNKDSMAQGVAGAPQEKAQDALSTGDPGASPLADRQPDSTGLLPGALAAPAGDSASTGAGYVMKDGGDSKKALRKYMANFSLGKDRPDFGLAPPCRSYRALICLFEFDEYTGKLEVCDSRKELAAVQSSVRPFKSAYTDLLAMAKAAQTRLKNAVADTQKEMHKEKDNVSDARRRARGRPSKKG